MDSQRSFYVEAAKELHRMMMRSENWIAGAELKKARNAMLSAARTK